MSDLTDFLYARLDEDEKAAEAAKRETSVPDIGCLLRDGEMRAGRSVLEIGHERVLADVAGKRRIVSASILFETLAEQMPSSPTTGRATPAADIMSMNLKHLARAYADHPDYRAEWRP